MHFRVSSSKDWALALNGTEIGGELCIDGPASSIQYNTFRAGWYVMSRCYYALYMEGESRRRSSCLYGWIKQPQPRVFIYLSLFDRLASADIKRPYISDDYSWCFNSFLLLTAIWNNIKNKNKIKKKCATSGNGWSRFESIILQPLAICIRDRRSIRIQKMHDSRGF